MNKSFCKRVINERVFSYFGHEIIVRSYSSRSGASIMFITLVDDMIVNETAYIPVGNVADREELAMCSLSTGIVYITHL